MCSAGVCEVLYNRLTDSQETEGQEETGDSVHRLTGSQETEGQDFPFGDDDDVQGEDDDDQGEYDDDQGEAEYDEGLFLYLEISDEMLPEMVNYNGLLSKVRKIVKFFRYDLKNEILQSRIEDLQKASGVPVKSVKLTLDVRTRWNSVISMLNSFLKVCNFVSGRIFSKICLQLQINHKKNTLKGVFASRTWIAKKLI